MSAIPSMIRRAVPLLCIASACVALAIVTATLMPLPGHRFGEDWGIFFSYMLVGENWVRLNGWFTPPYFTPAFCGGMPWLANPQSVFWSPFQVLFNILGPNDMPWATLLICAGMGAAGTWLLVRQSFAASREAAGLAGALFALNGFVAFRIVVGHLTWASFPLIPLLAWLVLGEAISRRGFVGRAISVGALMALMVFAGALNFIVPAVLAIAAIILLRQVRTGMIWTPWLILAAGCVWSIPLAAIKLIPSAVLMAQYPRSYLEHALFVSPVLFLHTLLSGLFEPGHLTRSLMSGPKSFVLRMHEFEFGVGIVPLILLGAWVLSSRGRGLRTLHLWPLALLVAVFAIPVAGTLGDEAWGRMLMRIPIVNNNSNLIRWWTIYMLPLIIGAAIALDSMFAASRWRSLVLVLASAVAIVQFSTRDLSYYRTDSATPHVDASSIIAARARLDAGEGLRPIARLGLPGDLVEWYMRLLSFVEGTSSLPCYEAIFGYSLEQFPATELHQGPIESDDHGFINLADPRCYLDPGGAVCRPGTRFAAGDPAIDDFVHYRPIPWRQPIWQRLATASSLTALALSFLASIWLLLGCVRRPAGGFGS